MSCFVVQATPDLVYEVSKNMREKDLSELLAVRFDKDREQLANSLALQYGNFPMAFCIGRDNVPIAILVAVSAWPGVWSMGLWATPDLPKVGKFLTKFAVSDLFAAIRAAGCHRVECKSIIGYDSVHKWLRFLGFVSSKHPEKMYGKNGEDFLTFYWTEDMPPPSIHRSLA